MQPTQLDKKRFWRRLGSLILIIALGLAIRKFDLGLPFAIWKYCGSILWGAMVYFLVALPADARNRDAIALMAAAIALLVEFSRLVHTPELDAFRATQAGALLLGRYFSPFNILAYFLGIACARLCDRGFHAPSKNISHQTQSFDQ